MKYYTSSIAHQSSRLPSPHTILAEKNMYSLSRFHLTLFFPVRPSHFNQPKQTIYTPSLPPSILFHQTITRLIIFSSEPQIIECQDKCMIGIPLNVDTEIEKEKRVIGIEM